MEIQNYDAIVVGGGLAGCRTANLLHRKYGFERVLILEASDRIGGRLHTVHLDPPIPGGKKSVVDLGGMWQGAKHHRLVDLADELGIELYEQYEAGRHAVFSQNAIHWYKGTIPLVPSATGVLSLLEAQISLLWAIDIMAELVPANYYEQPWQFPEASLWDCVSVRSWAEGKLWFSDTILMLETAVAMVFGVQASEVSMLFFLFAVKTSGGLSQLIDNRGGSQHARMKSGAMSLCTALLRQAEAVDVRLNSPVTCIQYRAATADDGPSVIVEAKESSSSSSSSSSSPITRRFAARYCIVCAPPSISFETIRFAPPLSFRRQQAMSRCFMGCYTKAIVRYLHPFWRDQGLSGMCVNMKPTLQLPISAIFDYCSAEGVHETQTIALVCFTVGEIAIAFNALTAEQKDRAVLDSLVHFFGEQARDESLLVDVTIKEWANEPYTRGCPINIFPAGGYLQVGHLLRQPIDDCLFFAGTETAMSAPGYMEGALESAVRVTQEIADSKNGLPTQPDAAQPPPSPYSPTTAARFRIYKFFDFRLWLLFFLAVLIATFVWCFA